MTNIKLSQHNGFFPRKSFDVKITVKTKAAYSAALDTDLGIPDIIDTVRGGHVFEWQLHSVNEVRKAIDILEKLKGQIEVVTPPPRTIDGVHLGKIKATYKGDPATIHLVVVQPGADVAHVKVRGDSPGLALFLEIEDPIEGMVLKSNNQILGNFLGVWSVSGIRSVYESGRALKLGDILLSSSEITSIMNTIDRRS